MKKRTIVMIVILILLAALFLRFPGFYLPHTLGDQLGHLALAMKLDKFGFSGYNLREANVYKSEDGFLVSIMPAEKGAKGNLLDNFPFYYDAPLFYKPPLFMYALGISHKIFAFSKPYSAVTVNIGFKALTIRPKTFFRAQFYCVFIPILFSLLLITATFFLGKTLFSDNVGIYAAVLLSMSPIELLSSQRIWPAGMVSFFMAAAFILYYLAKDKRDYFLACLSGISAGLASLSKGSGNIALFIILAYEIWGGKNTFKVFLAFFAVFALTAAPWHWSIFRTYGRLFYLPALNYPELINQHAWFKFVFNRPWYMYLVNIPVQTPLLILAYPAMFTAFRDKDKKLFLFIWIAVFLASFYIGRFNRELRHMLPIYPALAVFSAEALESARKKLNTGFGRQMGTLAIGILIILCCLWSGYVGLSSVFKNAAYIKMPL